MAAVAAECQVEVVRRQAEAEQSLAAVCSSEVAGLPTAALG